MNTGSEELLTTESRISVLCWCFYYDISVALKNQKSKVPTEIWESLSINISKQVVYLIWSENAKGKNTFGHWISDCLHFRVFSFCILKHLENWKVFVKFFLHLLDQKGNMNIMIDQTIWSSILRKLREW